MNLTIKSKNLSVKIAWFLAVVAGVLTKTRGDWLDFLFCLFGAVMGLYLISLLFAWILSFIINKVVNKEEEQKKPKTYLFWIMIILSAMSILGTIIQQ
jgi:ABC-type multidrug transport system fused ATPase/permease subunit